MIKNLLLLISAALMITGCAKTGTPTGGKKDETPPEHVQSKPPLGSVNTKPDDISIQFNEFIQLDNVHQELIVSPPLEARPEIELKGRSIEMTLFDTLQENTTYTFNFGNAVNDFREGNILPNFIYVFSTGPYLDSMAVTGRVVDAFTLQPLPKDERVKILLYKNLSDTAFRTQRPLYVGQADENGYFSVPYLQTGEYAIFGLAENNRSYTYDAEGEKIAFLDSTFLLDPQSFPEMDSAMIDSLAKHPTDTLESDSLQPDYDLEYAFHLDMYIFEEDQERQRLSQVKRDNRKYFDMIFNKPHPEKIDIRLLNIKVDTSWYLMDENPTSDTIRYWITDSSVYQQDTLVTELGYFEQDQNDTFRFVTDTVQLIHYERKQARRQNREDDEKAAEPKPVLTLNTGGRKGTREINRSLPIQSQTPIAHFQQDSMKLTFREDTLQYEQEFTIVQDSANPKRLILDTEWKPGYRYDLTLLPEAVTDIYHISNDTIQYNFSIRKADYYGQMNLTLEGITSPTIIQLLQANNENVYREFFVSQDIMLNLEYLHPKEYMLKAIFDTNENGKWDTGNLEEKKQPERVQYLPATINIRSNWEIEQVWELNPN